MTEEQRHAIRNRIQAITILLDQLAKDIETDAWKDTVITLSAELSKLTPLFFPSAGPVKK
jgi:hypothetical protein